MIDERWQQIDNVFAAALEHPVEERGAWLAESYPDDPTLRRAVERLLAFESEAGNFFSTPFPALEASGVPNLDPPNPKVGPYRLERLLGRGGMGRVYLAARDDGQFERKVAIKLLRGPGTSMLLRRFRTERQILARFEHPSIARLIDGGVTEDGQLYLVLEFVDGLPIDRFCRHARLSLPQRLRLFIDICSAVSYAHQQLIVHRDLKPANILVTEGGSCKLLDFGIAKVLDPRSFPHEPMETRNHQRLLTLQYASPEQVMGHVSTTATDIYGLGLLLFEMVTGEHPLPVDGLSIRDAERRICDHIPASASTSLARRGGDPSLPIRPRQLAGDLDTILAKALAKEPSRRYRSVRHLTEDIERHLDRRPIQARGGGWLYRGSRFLSRYAWGVTATGVIFLALLYATLASMGHSRQLARERHQAEVARERAERVSSYLGDVFSHASPTTSRGEPPTARDLLSRGAGGVLAGLEDEPEVQVALMLNMADANTGLGHHTEAIGLLEPARRKLQRLHGPTDPRVADASIRLGPLWVWRDDTVRAQAYLREALALRLKAFGQSDLRTIDARFALASFHTQQGEFKEARRLLRGVLESRRDLLGDAHLDTLKVQHELAAVADRVGDRDEAIRLLSSALPGLRRALGHDHPDVAVALHNLGVLVEDPHKAKDLLSQALSLRRRLYDADDPRTAKTLSNLALAHARLADPRAIPLANEALVLRRRRLGNDHPQISHALGSLGAAFYGVGRVDEAIDQYRLSIKHGERTLGPDHPSVAYPTSRLGNILLDEGRAQEAEPLLRRAFEIRQATMDDTAPLLRSTRADLERCLRSLGRHAEADDLFPQEPPSQGPLDSRD
ncbi:MAG: tetratricopeptide repeat protein [Acidobacteriota bacterium]